MFLCTQMSQRCVEVANMTGRLVKDKNGAFVPMATQNKGSGSKGKGKGKAAITSVCVCNMVYIWMCRYVDAIFRVFLCSYVCM